MRVVDELRDLVELADASLTGLKVGALALLSDGSVRRGSNRESYGGVQHAEKAAFGGYRGTGTIQELHLMSSISGFVGAKKAVPCLHCSRMMERQRLATPESQLFLYGFNMEEPLQFPLQVITSSYELSLPPSRIEGSQAELAEALEWLTPIDRMVLTGFIAALTADGPPIDVYLTGSACGRGGPRATINQQVLGAPYQDIDLVFVGRRRPEELKAAYDWVINDLVEPDPPFSSEIQIRGCSVGDRGEFIVNRHEPFSSDGYEPRLSYQQTVLFSSRWLVEPEPPFQKKLACPSSFDISVGTTLEQTMDPTFRERNWYRQLILRP